MISWGYNLHATPGTADYYKKNATLEKSKPNKASSNEDECEYTKGYLYYSDVLKAGRISLILVFILHTGRRLAMDFMRRAAVILIRI